MLTFLALACADATLSIKREPPNVVFVEPIAGAAVRQGSLLEVIGRVSDPETEDPRDLVVSLTVSPDEPSLEVGPVEADGTVRATLTPERVGDLLFTLVATDADAYRGEASLSITVVANAAPVVAIVVPTDGGREAPGALEIVVTTSDPDDADLTLAWTVGGDVAACPDVADGSGVTTCVVEAAIDPALELCVTATDPGGAAGADCVTIEVGCDDLDGDTFGTCTGDCDDLDPEVFPGALERCNGRDDDCDGVIPAEERDDADGDGVVDCDDAPNQAPAVSMLVPFDGSEVPPGPAAVVIAVADPDDAVATLALEWSIDGVVDAGCPAATDAVGGAVCVMDVPAVATAEICARAEDPWGATGEACHTVVPGCTDADGDGWLPCPDDCDDADPEVHPGAVERCNGIDDDCDGVVPIDEYDSDGDGLLDCEDQSYLSFDGSDRVEIPGTESLHPAQFTLELWFRTSGTGTQGMIGKHACGSTNGFLLGLNGAGMSTEARLSGEGAHLRGTTNWADGAWHHIAGTWDGTNEIVYVDGVVDAARTSTLAPVANGHPIMIGRYGPDPACCCSIEGDIDDVRVWSVALPPEDLAASLLGVEPGLEAWWTFDDGAGQTASDATGSWPGTLGGTPGSDAEDPTWQPGGP